MDNSIINFFLSDKEKILDYKIILEILLCTILPIESIVD